MITIFLYPTEPILSIEILTLLLHCVSNPDLVRIHSNAIPFRSEFRTLLFSIISYEKLLSDVFFIDGCNAINYELVASAHNHIVTQL